MLQGCVPRFSDLKRVKPGSFGTCRVRKSERDGQNGKISVIFAPLKKYAPDVLSASDGS